MDGTILAFREARQGRVELSKDEKKRGRSWALPAPLAQTFERGALVPAKGPEALLTCWVKAACGDDGDLLGAPSALSGFESQGRSLESGSRGV